MPVTMAEADLVAAIRAMRATLERHGAAPDLLVVSPAITDVDDLRAAFPNLKAEIDPNAEGRRIWLLSSADRRVETLNARDIIDPRSDPDGYMADLYRFLNVGSWGG